MGVNTLAYIYLAHNFVDKRILKALKEHDYLMEELLLFNGEEIHEDIMAML